VKTHEFSMSQGQDDTLQPVLAISTQLHSTESLKTCRNRVINPPALIERRFHTACTVSGQLADAHKNPANSPQSCIACGSDGSLTQYLLAHVQEDPQNCGDPTPVVSKEIAQPLL